MRFNEQAVQPPPKAPKEEKPREMTKPGQYTGEDLRGIKKIRTGRGTF